MMQPVLSVVIANYNYGRFLEDAIKSVLTQGVSDSVELIICDAESTDNSVDVIKRYQDNIAWWCSEKDKGQSDAFNKGFSHAKGKFLTWLNADDWFAPNALKTVIRYIENNPNCEWFAGGGCRVDANGRIMKFNRTRKFQTIRANTGDLQTFGPSSFFARSLYERAGGRVDESFHYAMDVELWERFYHIGKVKYRVIPGYIWMFRVHESSKTASEDAGIVVVHDHTNKAWFRMHEENLIIRERYAKYKLNWWRRIISLSPYENIMSIVDTKRFRGRLWTDFFPKENTKRD